MNKQIKKMIRDIELQKRAIELKKEVKKNYTKTELNLMAKVAGIKYYRRCDKHDRAKKFGIDLPKRPRSRAVEITNPDGTMIVYPSMTKASKALGNFPAQIYTMIARGEARFL